MMLRTATEITIKLVLVILLVAPPGEASAAAKLGKAANSQLGVSAINLYTLPEHPVCGKPVRLIAEFHTNKPGKVDFVLHRREGRSQHASLTTQKVDDGYAERWSREYVYKNSVRREYMIVVKNEKFSTRWIPVEVKCSASGQHKGFASFKSH